MNKLFLSFCLPDAPITLPTARAYYSTDFRSVISAKNTLKSFNFTSGQITLLKGVMVVLGDNYKILRSSLRNFLPVPVSYLPQCPVLTPSALLPTRRKTKLEMLHYYKKKCKVQNRIARRMFRNDGLQTKQFNINFTSNQRSRFKCAIPAVDSFDFRLPEMCAPIFNFSYMLLFVWASVKLSKPKRHRSNTSLKNNAGCKQYTNREGKTRGPWHEFCWSCKPNSGTSRPVYSARKTKSKGYGIHQVRAGVPCFGRGYSNRFSFVNYIHLQTPSSCYSWKYNSRSAG